MPQNAHKKAICDEIYKAEIVKSWIWSVPSMVRLSHFTANTLRTVADGCDRKNNAEGTRLQPADLQSSTRTFRYAAMHSGTKEWNFKVQFKLRFLESKKHVCLCVCVSLFLKKLSLNVLLKNPLSIWLSIVQSDGLPRRCPTWLKDEQGIKFVAFQKDNQLIEMNKAFHTHTCCLLHSCLTFSQNV